MMGEEPNHSKVKIEFFWALKWQRAKLMDIKLPMYLFFYVALGLTDCDAGKSITRAIAGGGVFAMDLPASKSKSDQWNCKKIDLLLKFMAGVLAKIL